jgi:hypothetical protein
MPPDFQFDPRRHEYRVGGVTIPGCTRAIGDSGLTNFENVKAEILDRRSKLGRHVHTCCHYFDEGDLDRKTIDESAKGYVDSWALLCEDIKPKWRKIEYQFVASIDGLFCGMQIDREGDIYGHESIVDLKISRSIEKWHGVQTALYAMGLPHESLSSAYARFLRRRRYIAKLNETGKRGQLIPFEDKRDADVGKAALLISSTKIFWGEKSSFYEEEAA